MIKESQGEYLRRLRIEKGITQEEEAYDLHVDRTLITKIENDKVKLSSNVLELLSNYFNIDKDEIINRCTSLNIETNGCASVNNRKLLKIFIVTIFIILLLFFCYFFIIFYNSVSVYQITSDNGIECKGTFLKTNDYISLNLNFQNLQNISFVKLATDDETIITYENPLDNSIILYDNIKTQEYFNFKKYIKALNAMKMVVILNDGTKYETKLHFTRVYSNKDVFLENKNISFNYKDLPKSNFSDKLNNIYKNNGDYSDKIIINNIEYKINSSNDSMVINFYEDNINKSIVYKNYNNENIIKSENNIDIYKYSLSYYDCYYGKCDVLFDDEKVINEVMDYIIKVN